jgi:hypothetical protein
MYATETQDSTTTGLDRLLAEDASGELRDRLIDELYLAAREIEVVLRDLRAPDEAGTLRDLLEAVKLAGTVVEEAWQAFHS